MRVFVPLPHPFPNLADFGIQIPLMPSRASKILTAFNTHITKHNLAAAKCVLEWPVEKLLSRQDLARVHHPDYLDVLLSDSPEPAIYGAFELFDANGRPNRYDPASATRPWKDLVEAALLEASGTLAACEHALGHGPTYYLGGGMHHAMEHAGRGFCLINDIAIAIRSLQSSKRIATAWVIDVDAHKGDGTAAIFLGDNSVSTLSIHMARGWPLDESPWDDRGALQPQFAPSTIDLGIPAGSEGVYNTLLEAGLKQLAMLAGSTEPDLAVVVNGSDVFEGDALPSAALLRLSRQQCLQRDLLVYEFLRDKGIPQTWLLAGGYGPQAWEIHWQFIERYVGV